MLHNVIIYLNALVFTHVVFNSTCIRLMCDVWLLCVMPIKCSTIQNGT